jgi:hypothetical protein
MPDLSVFALIWAGQRLAGGWIAWRRLATMAGTWLSSGWLNSG